MNINRHNYEEYFILYLDNELSNEERRIVEDFAQNHPDLKEELDTLLQYRMVPDTSIIFRGKAELMKGVAYSPVNSSNYEEWLVLYIDNELTAEEIKDVEKFIAGNPAAGKELELLQKTKLQPEPITFANKKSLYREKETLRRMFVPWWRAAAAVLLITMGLTAFFVVANRRSTGNKDRTATANPGTQRESLVSNQSRYPVKNNTAVPAKEQKNAATISPFTDKQARQMITTVPKEVKNSVALKNKTLAKESKLPDNNTVVPLKDEKAITDNNNNNNNKPSNNLPLPVNNPRVNNTASNNAIATTNSSEEKINAQPVVTNPAVTSPVVQPSDIKPASYNASDADFGQNEKDGKKSKLRGFFRKLTRTFEKRTNINRNADDDKLLVGGLAIRLK